MINDPTTFKGLLPSNRDPNLKRDRDRDDFPPFFDRERKDESESSSNDKMDDLRSSALLPLRLSSLPRPLREPLPRRPLPRPRPSRPSSISSLLTSVSPSSSLRISMPVSGSLKSLFIIEFLLSSGRSLSRSLLRPWFLDGDPESRSLPWRKSKIRSDSSVSKDSSPRFLDRCLLREEGSTSGNGMPKASINSSRSSSVCFLLDCFLLFLGRSVSRESSNWRLRALRSWESWSMEREDAGGGGDSGVTPPEGRVTLGSGSWLGTGP